MKFTAAIAMITVVLTNSSPSAAVTAPSTSVQTPEPSFDKELKARFCTVKYSAGKEEDAQQVAHYADTGLAAMAENLEALDPHLMDDFDCTILLYSNPKAGLADDGTANSSTHNYGRSIVVSLLSPSSFSSQSRTTVGEQKDQDYVFNLVVNELSTVLFERITSAKGKGWYFHTAPQWFVQGIEGYYGLVYSSPHEFDTTLSKYISSTNARPTEVLFEPAIHVGNPYLGGVTLVAFLYEVYGASKVASLLLSPAPTFDEAFAASFGDDGSLRTKYQQWIVNRVRP